MTAGPSPYAIRGGQDGYERLLKLSRDRWPETQALLRRVGVWPGMRCADIGCGAGTVTRELARLVGPSGSVLGVDMDAVKLELARAEASRQGLANIEFRSQRVEDWAEESAYDAVYSRYLLQHLTDPVGLLRRMWNAVRPGGSLIVEDVDWDGWGSEPANGGLAFLVDRYNRTLRRRGGNPKFGAELYRHFLELGVPQPSVHLSDPVKLEPESRALAPVTLEFTSEAMIAEGVATPEEVDAALADLQQLVDDPRALLWGPRTFQVHGRKPAP